MSKPTVLYNGSCPICRREIEHYRRLDREGRGVLEWRDVANPASDEDARYLIDPESARQRLHVVDRDGSVLAGVPAFARIWENLPRYRWLGALVRVPIVRTVAAGVYAPMARLLYGMDRRRRRQSS